MTELSVLTKATIVLAFALAATRVAQRSPAAVRALMLSSAFAALLILPIVAFTAHERRIEIPLTYGTGSIVFFADDFGLEGPAPSRSSRGTHVPERPLFVLPALLTMLRAAWAAGFILLTAPVVISLLRVRRLRSRGVPWTGGTALVERLARQDGITRRIDLFLHDDVAAPMTCGVRRPAIVLPIDAPAWHEREVRHALVHELEHVRRADWPVHVLARIICGIYWFHPLVWIAWRRLRLESERACDDAVLHGSDRTAYAEQLVSLARRLSRDAHVPLLSMADRSNLTTRITAVLDNTIARGRARGTHAAAIVSAAVAFTVVIAPLEAVTRSSTASLQLGPPQVAAISAQVGLRLRETTAPTEHLVIEGAERPSPNDAPDAPAAAQRAPETPASPVESPVTGPDAPRFEVASVKRHASRDNVNFNWATVLEGGPFRATNSTLVRLIQIAYGLRPTDAVLGGPSWVTTDKFDVDAKPGARVSGTQTRLMIRTLLADRFKLVLRNESREMPIYSLTTARSDRRLGPQIARPTGECVNPVLALARAANAAPNRIPELSVTGPQPAVGQPGRSCGMQLNPGGVKAGSATMAMLATLLRQSLDRPIVDMTGLGGTFDFDLQFAAGRGFGVGTLPRNVATDPAADDSPSIFTALQEQLGLKLEPGRGPVDVLVIDRVEPPTEN